MNQDNIVEPYNANAERAIIRSIMLKPANLKILRESNSFSDFKVEKNKILIEMIDTMYEDGIPIEPSSVINELKIAGTLHRAGGEDYITEIVTEAITSTGILYYINIIKELRIKNDILTFSDNIKTLLKQRKSINEIAGDIVSFSQSLNGDGFSPDNIPLALRVQEYVDNATGIFKSTEIHNYLQLSTAKQKRNVSTILSRLAEKDVIEKYGKQNGVWVKVNKDLQRLDWYNADAKYVDLELGFDLHEIINIAPGSIIIVAGESNAGKTSFILDTIERNIGKMQIEYFCSELKDIGLNLRLQRQIAGSKLTLEDWRDNVNSWEIDDPYEVPGFVGMRAKPKSLILIDYLQIVKEYWEVDDILSKLHSRLNNAVCVVCLQKTTVSDMGVGGEKSRHKATLYIALKELRQLENGLKLQVKIMKLKDPKGINRNMQAINYEITDARNFYQVGSWYIPKKWVGKKDSPF